MMQSLISTDSSLADALSSKPETEVSVVEGVPNHETLNAALLACIAEFGYSDEDIEVDTEALAISRLANQFRGQILELIAHRQIGVRELARKLDVKPPTVSKFLNSNKDTKLSSWAVVAHALNAEFKVSLQDHFSCSFFAWPEMQQSSETKNECNGIANEKNDPVVWSSTEMIDQNHYLNANK
ncbi:winged helix-turn-helix domain-containing protein [Acetobacter sp. P5B1]|uniref:winged helix-turn-helix domain-containing protein n=1 Tax=Acetobacter sp. P5B1 TaxID=2762620 RepID=UPI001C03CC9B|nr:winged helix-turn-helix domain-containing protein [Acetobacter sp. P5B1]